MKWLIDSSLIFNLIIYKRSGSQCVYDQFLLYDCEREYLFRELKLILLSFGVLATLGYYLLLLVVSNRIPVFTFGGF